MTAILGSPRFITIRPRRWSSTARSWPPRRKSASRATSTTRFPAQRHRLLPARSGPEPEQLDYVGFYDKPLLKFERLLETYLAFAPQGFRSFLQAMPLWLKQKLYLPREMRKGLKGQVQASAFVFTEHHESHAASAFFPSPFDEAAILTLDGVGEWATASVGVGRGNRITLTHELRFPHSLGLLYSAFTYFRGFRVNSRRVQADGPGALRRAEVRRR